MAGTLQWVLLGSLAKMVEKLRKQSGWCTLAVQSAVLEGFHHRQHSKQSVKAALQASTAVGKEHPVAPAAHQASMPLLLGDLHV
jgi:hypothetical protein